jgi:hypothetical protein
MPSLTPPEVRAAKNAFQSDVEFEAAAALAKPMTLVAAEVCVEFE